MGQESIELSSIILSVAGFLSVYYIRQLSDSLKEAVQNIKELNSSMAVIIQRTETHAFEIEILRNKQDNLVNDIAMLKATIKVKD